MNLIKTSMLNGVAVVIKMLTLFGLNKIFAIYVGPAGYAALGQMQNAMQIAITIASGAVNTGVVKYTAEYVDEIELQKRLWRTATCVAVIGSLIVSVLVFYLSSDLSLYFFYDFKYKKIFDVFSIALIFLVLNSLLISILNGKKEIKRYVLANISSSLIALLVTIFLVVHFSLFGALLALVLCPSLSFFSTIIICYKLSWFKWDNLIGKWTNPEFLNLFKYTLMAIVSVACVPTCQVLIRSYVLNNFGLESAGILEGLWRMSAAYLMLITTTLSVYFLPRLSEIKKPDDLKREIEQGFKIIIPVVCFIAVCIFFLKDYIILLLFSKNFLAIRDLLAWQLVGDVLKISSWVLSYLMLSKALVRIFVLTEIVFSLLLLLLSFILVLYFGEKGVVLAYAVNYAIYFLFLYFYFFIYLKFDLNEQ